MARIGRSLRIGALAVWLASVGLTAGAEVPHPTGDPQWGDKKLSGWLEQLATGDAASRVTASNVIPQILNIHYHGCGGVLLLKPGESLPVYSRIGIADAPYAIPALIQALSDPEPKVQQGAALALSRCGPFAVPAVPALAKVVGKTGALEAIVTLGKLREAARPALPELRRALGDNRTRLEAAKAIWLIAREPDVITALVEEFPERGGYRELRDFFESEVGPAAQHAVPLLVNVLNSTNSGVRFGQRLAAILLLGAIGPGARDAVPALLEAYRHEPVPGASYPLRAEIFKTLGKIGPDSKAAIPLLLEGMHDSPKGYERDASAAVEALGCIGPQSPDVIPALLEEFKDNDRGPHATAMNALCKIGPAAKDAVPTLIEMLKSRAHAQDVNWVLRSIGPAAKDAIPEMLRCLDDPDCNLHFRVLEALERMEAAARPAAPRLLQILSDPATEHSVDWSFLVRALWAIDHNPAAITASLRALENERFEWPIVLLGEMGPKAASALPRLRARLNDKNPQIRVAAVEAVWRISGDAEMLRTLERTLHGDDQLAAVLAAEALWKIDRRPAAITFLEAAAYRTAWPVPGRAQSILKSIRDESKLADE